MPLHRGLGKIRWIGADNRRSSLTRDCLRAVAASRALANASSMFSPSVMSCGSRGEVTTYPPSTAGARFKTSLPSLTVYRVFM